MKLLVFFLSMSIQIMCVFDDYEIGLESIKRHPVFGPTLHDEVSKLEKKHQAQKNNRVQEKNNTKVNAPVKKQTKLSKSFSSLGSLFKH